MRPITIAVSLVGSLVVASPTGAQGLDGVMAGIRNGGGWVSVPIVEGSGVISTLPLPTLGLTLAGCIRVWDGHTGRWDIRARETVEGATLEANSGPGEGVRFSHTFGVRSQLEFEFAWSEPRDTTLFLWVGLDDPESGRDACTPVS